MTAVHIDQQEHGYRSGHQLLSASLRLPRDDQDMVDRLSDMAGQLRPGETFHPYITTYPLPSMSHYVVARTWQDVEAPRAGCVLTRSLLVPMFFWESTDSIGRLMPLLTPVRAGEKVRPVGLPSDSAEFRSVIDPRTVELVEALFLEARQAIVFFEAQDAEAIATRILSALWPSLRRIFAVCTFTLAPRKVAGRDFDLLFAPKSARSRFGDWSGRRIDVSTTQSPRHRWSSVMAHQIFQSDVPSLVASDALGVLSTDRRGDESALRLSLLWNELAAKAETTPTAVLGMLDILNSQKENSPPALKRLSPLIAKSAETAVKIFSAPDAWRFLTALVAKFPTRFPSATIARKIGKSASNLAKQDVNAAIEFLEAQSASSHPVPVAILTGLANGVGRSQSRDVCGELLTRVSPDIGLGLVSLSNSFARQAAFDAKSHPYRSIPRLVSVLATTSDRAVQRKVRRRIAPFLDDAMLAPLLPPLLEGVSGQELADFATRIGRQTKFSIPAFDEPICNAAKDFASLQALRAAIAADEGEGADRFLISTLNLNSNDIAWLKGNLGNGSRARSLLLRLLEKSPDRHLVAVQRDASAREGMLKLLLEDVPTSALQISRLLMLAELPIDDSLEIGFRILNSMPSEEGDKLARYLISRALVEASPEDRRLSTILSYSELQIRPQQLIQMATARMATSRRIGSNVVLLAEISSNRRNGIVLHIDELSDRLIHRGRENLGELAYDAWASMIADAGSIDRDAQLRAAMPALSFALRLNNVPVSSLIVVTFPIVYEQLLRSTGDEDFKNIPALLTLPMSFFIDWDRAKSARHELVDAFVNSSWPPANLLLASMKAGIDQQIIKRLDRNYGGREYLTAIRRDSRRLSAYDRMRVEESLSKYDVNR